MIIICSDALIKANGPVVKGVAVCVRVGMSREQD